MDAPVREAGAAEAPVARAKLPFRSGARPRFPRRNVLPFFIAILGAAITVFAWIAEQGAISDNRVRLLTATARSEVASLAGHIRRNITDVREMGKYWQLYGLDSLQAWRFDTSMFLDSHQGVVWICWVGRDSSDFRLQATDSTVVPHAELIAAARQAIEEPTQLDISAFESEAGFYLSVPVRTPEDSIGVLLGAVRADSMIVPSSSPMRSILALQVRNPGGGTICSVGVPSAQAPRWMMVQEYLQVPSGESWILEFRPTDAFFQLDKTPSIRFFLLAGLLLSGALGVLAFQFLRLRDYSTALSDVNRELDDRIHALSDADHRLREANAQLELNVQQRTGQLTEAVDEISAFGHSVSHDLRSPIGAIMNFAGVLEEDYANQIDEEGKRILRRIRTSGETATQILDRLLQYLWVGRKEPERKMLDMNELARSAWSEALAGDPDGSAVDFQLAELPPASGDPELVHRVFVNLLSNSLKYSRGRTNRRIDVLGESENGWSTYTVLDNGVGFDPKDERAIFQPFRRLHGQERFEGAGLGLAITAKIVRRHGGRIWAESDGTTGASFHLTLPSGATDS